MQYMLKLKQYLEMRIQCISINAIRVITRLYIDRDILNALLNHNRE